VIKPVIESSQVAALLSDYFDQPITEIVPLGTGHIARVFSFQAGDLAYVIRFVTAQMAHTLKKEAFIATLLAATDIPLPPILHQGTFQDDYFAVAPKAPGTPLYELSPEAYKQIMPTVIETLDAIHQIDVGRTEKYGIFDDTGVGLFPSWHAHLLSVSEEEAEDSFFGKWHRLFEESFLERELFDQLLEQMKSLLVYTLEERFLVHGDYGFNNLLADDGKITAVLDWANAQYGDFVYDIAWLDFYSPGVGYGPRFQQHYQAQNRLVPYFAERLRCYQCYISLNALRFYAKADLPEAYGWARQRILGILGLTSSPT
jgi:hygromycin-B 4-O-kinase